MQVIWKYEVPLVDEPIIEMPEGAQVLALAVQHDEPHIWVLCDDTAQLVPYRFRLVGTGHPAAGLDSHSHLGTVVFPGGALVLHLFGPLGA